MGFWRARQDKVPRTALRSRGEALPALWKSLGEILLPFLILVLFLRGITTLVETGAVAVIYATRAGGRSPPGPEDAPAPRPCS